MRHTGHTLLVAALAVAVLAAVPGGAVAAGDLAVSGDQADDGTVTVTVTENGSAVANASVTVEALNNSSYGGEGDYTTGENGTVDLPAPEQNVSVQVTASANNTTAEATLDLVAPTDDGGDGLAVGVTQADDGSATVSVTNGSGAGVANASVAVTAQDNVSYAGEGDYTTGENGTVDLPAPEQNVTVDVVADANNQTASTTATLTAVDDTEGGENSTFGERVSAFVHQLQANGNMSGQQVAAFVVDNNPGADNRPDHVDPGPPEDDDEDGDDDDRGKDGDAGNGNGADGNNGNGADGNNGNSDGANGNNGNGNGADDDETGNPGNGNGGGNGNNGNGSGNGNGGGNGNGSGNGNNGNGPP